MQNHLFRTVPQLHCRLLQEVYESIWIDVVDTKTASWNVCPSARNLETWPLIVWECAQHWKFPSILGSGLSPCCTQIDRFRLFLKWALSSYSPSESRRRNFGDDKHYLSLRNIIIAALFLVTGEGAILVTMSDENQVNKSLQPFSSCAPLFYKFDKNYRGGVSRPPQSATLL